MGDIVALSTGAPSLSIAARETPWYRLFLHTPLTTLATFVILSLIAKENYPFSHFPMYARPSAETGYFGFTDGGGNPLPVGALTGVTSPQVGKTYRKKSMIYTTEIKKSGEESRTERDRVVGAEIFEMLRQRCGVHDFLGCAVSYPASSGYTALKGLRLQPPDALLNSWLLVQSQVVVAGSYLVAFLTKIFSTGGMWFWNANYIALDLIKTQRQNYFSGFDAGDARNPVAAMWLLEHPWITRGLFASAALLEAIAFLALASRRLGFLIVSGLFSCIAASSFLWG